MFVIKGQLWRAFHYDSSVQVETLQIQKGGGGQGVQTPMKNHKI